MCKTVPHLYAQVFFVLPLCSYAKSPILATEYTGSFAVLYRESQTQKCYATRFQEHFIFLGKIKVRRHHDLIDRRKNREIGDVL